MLDPVLRHRHLVDADIVEQSMDTLAPTKLRTDGYGNIVPFPEAGRRRIDYIMCRKDTPVVSCCFSMLFFFNIFLRGIVNTDISCNSNAALKSCLQQYF